MGHENVEDIIALTPVQQIMFLHSVGAPIPFALAHQFRYRVEGELDIDRFRRAWQHLSVRHPALRTSFLWEGLKAPVQVVHRKVTLPFDFVDLSSMPSTERDQRLSDIQEADRRRGFELQKAPLTRVTLLRLSEHCHHMLWTRHHLILDRWCVDLLFDELFETYDGRGAKEVEGGFRDYLAWIRAQNPNEAEQHWRGVLRGFDEPTLLFEGRKRRSQWRFEDLPCVGETVPDALHRQLRSLAADTRVSVAVVLQGAVALLVSKWSGSTDVVFGLSVSGRPADLPRVERIMGSFINTVPVRVTMEPATLVRDWLKSIHASQVERFRYEYVSPVEIQRYGEAPSGKPLFDFLALLHSPTLESRQGPGFSLEQVAGPIESAYPFSLSLEETAGHLQLVGAYDPDLVAEQTAKSLLADLRTILSDIVSQRQSRLSELLVTSARPALTPTHGDQLADASSRPPVSPQGDSDMAIVLADIWSRALGCERVGMDDDFFALGGTSVQAATAFAEMERRLGVVLPLWTLINASSIRQILEIHGQAPPRTSGLIEMQPNGTRPRLFVIPGMGGHVVGLAGLARALGPDQPLYGLESKGLDGREEPLNRIEDLAARFLEETASLRDAPFVLLGICWGSLVAFEMACELVRIGCPPEMVILMDPSLENDDTNLGPTVLPRSRAAVMAAFCLGRARLYWKEFRARSGRDRLRWLGEKKDLLVSMIRHRDPFRGDRSEIIQRKIYWSHLEAVRRYRPSRYPGRLHILKTAVWDREPELDPRQQFMAFVRADSRVSYVPGKSAVEAVSRQNVGELANRIKDDIDRVIETCA